MSANPPLPELEGIEVYAAVDGEPMLASSLLVPSSAASVRITCFFTHFAGLNAWEYAQKLISCREALEAVGAEVVVIGIGTDAAARLFADQLDFPSEQLFADPTGACARSLGFSQGPFTNLNISPFAKLLAMLGGIGSPGTLEAIVQGFLGDKDAEAEWVAQALAQGAAKGRFPADLPASTFSPVGTTGLRPFELATLRLQNVVQGIIANWGSLAPADPQLTLQQGGTVVVNPRGEVIYRYADEGILVYTPVEEMIASIREATSAAEDAWQSAAWESSEAKTAS